MNQNNHSFFCSSSIKNQIKSLETNNHNKQFNSSISLLNPIHTTISTTTTTTITTTAATNPATQIILTPTTPTLTPIHDTNHENNKNTTHIIPFSPDKNHNQPTTITTTTSKDTPPSTHHQHSDGDDFDLDGDLDEEDSDVGPLLHHSGDGGLIDSTDDDDDHTGDDDADDHDIIKPSHHDDLGKTKPIDDRKPVIGSKDDEDDFGEIDFDAGQPIDHGRNNDNDDDLDEEDKDENDEKDDEDDYEVENNKEDNSPIYTDITDPTDTDSSSSSSTSTSTTTDKRRQCISLFSLLYILCVDFLFVYCLFLSYVISLPLFSFAYAL